MPKGGPRGGPRSGSGRKPGANWNGSNSYERGIRFSATLRPDLYRWLKAEAQRRGVSMAALVNEAVREMMK